jgi:hypothetical protein
MGCKTRWGSHLRQFKKLFSNRQAILAVLRNPAARDYIDDTLHDYCFDSYFWVDLSELIDILTPLTEKLTILEGDMYVSLIFRLRLVQLAMLCINGSFLKRYMIQQHKIASCIRNIF